MEVDKSAIPGTDVSMEDSSVDEPIRVPVRLHVDDENNVDENTSDGNNAIPSTISAKISKEELAFFGAIRGAVQALKEEKLIIPTRPDLRTLTVRIAGGWVRDVVVIGRTPTAGASSAHDLDVVVDACTGVEFANLLQEYLKMISTDVASDIMSMNSIGVIAANPEQSKHLETATFRFANGALDIDCCNLRHESYADAGNTRIPSEMAFGTPKQDAYRRDLTINALFLLIGESDFILEDWTRRGLHDLTVSRTIVTPLAPLQTFLDDPLRLIRCVRFAARLGMDLDDSIVRAVSDHPEITQALIAKVSKERIGTEVGPKGMLGPKGVHKAQWALLQLIDTLNLANAVFCPELNEPLHGAIGVAEPFTDIQENNTCAGWQESKKCLQAAQSVLDGIGDSFGSRINLTWFWLASTWLPFRRLYYEHPKKKDKQISLVFHMAREGLKLTNADVQALELIMNDENISEMQRLLREEENETGPSFRVPAGMLLRRVRDPWTTLLAVVTVHDMVMSGFESNPDVIARAVDLYDKIVKKNNLDRCWSTLKPLLNGKQLLQSLPLLPKKGGPAVGRYMQHQIEWMLGNPNNQNVEELVSHLQDISVSDPELGSEPPAKQPKR